MIFLLSIIFCRYLFDLNYIQNGIEDALNKEIWSRTEILDAKEESISLFIKKADELGDIEHILKLFHNCLESNKKKENFDFHCAKYDKPKEKIGNVLLLETIMQAINDGLSENVQEIGTGRIKINIRRENLRDYVKKYAGQFFSNCNKNKFIIGSNKKLNKLLMESILKIFDRSDITESKYYLVLIIDKKNLYENIDGYLKKYAPGIKDMYINMLKPAFNDRIGITLDKWRYIPLPCSKSKGSLEVSNSNDNNDKILVVYDSFDSIEENKKSLELKCRRFKYLYHKRVIPSEMINERCLLITSDTIKHQFSIKLDNYRLDTDFVGDKYYVRTITLKYEFNSETKYQVSLPLTFALGEDKKYKYSENHTFSQSLTLADKISAFLAFYENIIKLIHDPSLLDFLAETENPEEILKQDFMKITFDRFLGKIPILFLYGDPKKLPTDVITENLSKLLQIQKKNMKSITIEQENKLGNLISLNQMGLIQTSKVNLFFDASPTTPHNIQKTQHLISVKFDTSIRNYYIYIDAKSAFDELLEIKMRIFFGDYEAVDNFLAINLAAIDDIKLPGFTFTKTSSNFKVLLSRLCYYNNMEIIAHLVRNDVYDFVDKYFANFPPLNVYEEKLEPKNGMFIRNVAKIAKIVILNIYKFVNEMNCFSDYINDINVPYVVFSESGFETSECLSIYMCLEIQSDDK